MAESKVVQFGEESVIFLNTDDDPVRRLLKRINKLALPRRATLERRAKLITDTTDWSWFELDRLKNKISYIFDDDCVSEVDFEEKVHDSDFTDTSAYNSPRMDTLDVRDNLRQEFTFRKSIYDSRKNTYNAMSPRVVADPVGILENDPFQIMKDLEREHIYCIFSFDKNFEDRFVLNPVFSQEDHYDACFHKKFEQDTSTYIQDFRSLFVDAIEVIMDDCESSFDSNALFDEIMGRMQRTYTGDLGLKYASRVFHDGVFNTPTSFSFFDAFMKIFSWNVFLCTDEPHTKFFDDEEKDEYIRDQIREANIVIKHRRQHLSDIHIHITNNKIYLRIPVFFEAAQIPETQRFVKVGNFRFMKVVIDTEIQLGLGGTPESRTRVTIFPQERGWVKDAGS